MKRSPIPKKRKGPPRRGRVLNPHYLDWIRGIRCVVCWLGGIISVTGFRQVEAAHVGKRGLGQKCSDEETIPLCPWHHREGWSSHHVLGKAFWGAHSLNRERLIASLQARYIQETGRPLKTQQPYATLAQD